jgi:hypothetical protein
MFGPAKKVSNKKLMRLERLLVFVGVIKYLEMLFADTSHVSQLTFFKFLN